MPPFNLDEHFDRAALDALPEDGIPEGLDEREQDETIDDDDAGVVSGGSKERGDDDDSGSHDGRCRLHMSSDEDESDNDEQSGENGPADAPINSHLLGTWLADGSGPLATEARRHARLTDIGLESALNALHDTPHTEPRATSITVRKLAARLVAMDCLNGQAAEASVVIDMLHRELVLSVEQLGISFDGSGLACNHRRKTGHSPAEESVDALNEILGVGTRASPFQMPARGTIPLSEYKARGYMTLCFPTLFPFGRGHFEDERRTSNLGFDRWAQHLEKYYDGRFSSHARWPYFVQNTRERAIANDNAQTFLNTTTTRLTVGDVRRLSVAGKQEVFGRVSKFASTLRNTPAFFGERRKELLYMCEQLGDPHVFATNSFADTYCPHCARFIIAHLEHTPRKVHDANSPFADGLTANEAHSRRYRLMKENPHLAATFFHLKTQLYIEHICYGILGADAHWVRYEWQSRGSTHAHYFLWFRDAPPLDILDEWVSEAFEGLSNTTITAEQLSGIVSDLNERARQACSSEPGASGMRRVAERPYIY